MSFSGGRRSRSNSETLLRAPSRGSLERLILESPRCNGPIASHEDHTWLFRVVQCVVFLARLITPFSYVYMAALFTVPLTPDTFPGGEALFWVVTVWMAAEAAFFPYYVYLFVTLNSPNDDLQHFASDPASRRCLMEKCFAALLDSARMGRDPPYMYIRKVMEGWFLDEPLANVHRDNAAAWTSWAFFGKDYELMTAAETQENHEIVRYIERMAEWTFPAGFQAQTAALRLNLDPVFATQRPFLFYATINLANVLTHAALRWMGFHVVMHGKALSRAQNIYRRPAQPPPGAMAAAPGATGGSAATPGRLPIVFVHGIGVGFAHYLGLIAGLPCDVDVFLVEWPYVAMQMATSGPTVDEAVNHVIAVLDHFRHPRACFVAHSLGTSLVSWMVHDQRGARRVASSVLLDPVTFLLCDPTVASVFVYKDPESVVDLLMHFFLSRELFIANALSRHFAWSHNILFVEDLLNSRECCRQRPHLVVPASAQMGEAASVHIEGRAIDADAAQPHHLQHRDVDHTIFLSTQDSIVPISSVSRYLQAKAEQGYRTFETILFDGLHGELFLWPQWVRKVLRKVEERATLRPGDM